MLISLKKFLILVFIFSFGRLVNSEVFSAIEGLEKLAIAEEFIINEFKLLVNELNDDYLNKKLKTWQDEYDLVEHDVIRYISNPLNALLMIKRATADIECFLKRFPKETKKFHENIKKLMPDNNDLTGAVEGLIRLQFIYKLKSEDFANGIIDGEVTRKPLSPHDLFVIGTEALKFSDQFYYAEEYLKLAIQKLKNGLDVDGELDENLLGLHLIATYNKIGDYPKAIAIVNDLIEKHPENEQFKATEKVLKDQLEKFGSNKLLVYDPLNEGFTKDGTFNVEKEKILLSQVCRGNLTKTPEELSKLHCRYVSSSAFSKLARFKIEEANIEPYIVLFIDVIYDSEIQFLQKESKPKIERAEILSDNSLGSKSSVRVAQIAWHWDFQHRIVEKITQRVEVMWSNLMNVDEV